MKKITKEQIQKNRETWLTALRSGEFKQGFNGSLHETETFTGEDEFCCIGVACKLFSKELNLDVYNGVIDSCVWYGDVNSTAPSKLIEYLGMYSELGRSTYMEDDDDPVYSVEPSHRTLATLNDENQMSFSEIADVLEQGNHWKNLDE